MKKSYFFAGVSILFWSTFATISKLMLGSFNNFQVLCINSLLAAAALLVINIVTKKYKILKNYRLKDYVIMALIGLPGTFFYYVFYYAGADILTSASQAFIINYMWPIMSVVFACIILKEKLTIRKIAAIIMSFVGVVVVAGGDIMNFSNDTLKGVCLCFSGAVMYGLFTALNKKMKYETSIAMMINFFVSFLLTGCIIVIRGEFFTFNILQFAGFLWGGVFSMGIANTTWILALSGANTAKISNLAYITPFLSLIWTSLILKDAISLYSVIGLVIIVGGILIQLKDKKQTE